MLSKKYEIDMVAEGHWGEKNEWYCLIFDNGTQWVNLIVYDNKIDIRTEKNTNTIDGSKTVSNVTYELDKFDPTKLSLQIPIRRKK